MAGTALKIDQRSLSRVLAKIEKLGEDMKDKARKSLHREGERIMGVSKREVPVDTGALRASGFVESRENGEIVTTLGYGGASTDYAVVVHEDLGAKHTTGKAKYLEDPVRANVKRVGSRLKKDLKL